VSPLPKIDERAYLIIKKRLERKPQSTEELAQITGLQIRTVQRYLVRLRDELLGTGRALWAVEQSPQRWAIVDLSRVRHVRP